MTSFAITPVGRVEGGRDAPVDDDWGESRAVLPIIARLVGCRHRSDR